MSSCVAGTADFRERLLKLIDETEINSAVIDIKDYSGAISFPPENTAQIQASYDAGVMSWMIWAPSNIYTKGALKAQGTSEIKAVPIIP